jgi:hypothetical protein
MRVLSLTEKLSLLEMNFRIWIKKNPKINIFLINFAQLCNMASAMIKKFFEKCIIYLNKSIKKLIAFTGSVGDFVIDFVINSPTSVIDLIIYWNQLTKIEMGKTICLLLICINTVRIVFFIKRTPCDALYCPNYIGGIQTQLRIIQRLYIQLILTIFVCIGFIARTADSRIILKGMGISVYKYQKLIYKCQIPIYFLIFISWYDIGKKIWFFKRNNTPNSRVIRFISIQNFKKILRYFFTERYNNRDNTKLEFKIQGNLNFLKYEDETLDETIMISLRLINPAEENLTKNPFTTQSNVKPWENLDYRMYRRILRSIDKYSKSRDFIGIFLAVEYKKQTTFTDADTILSNWNFLYSLILFCLTIYEFMVEYQKNKKEVEKEVEEELEINV